MVGFNDLRRLAYGASIVAREAAKQSKAIEAATSGDIAGTLRPAADIHAQYVQCNILVLFLVYCSR